MVDALYCSALVLFPRVQGQDEGITQQASAGCALSCVMNHPLDIAFKSTNVFGWPQLVVSVYGPDMLGRDVLLGTGCGRVPVTAGR